MRAYPDGQRQKDVIVEKVASAIANRSFLGDFEDSVQMGCSMMAVVADGNDPRAYERAVGIPGGLGLLAEDAIGALLEDLPAARAFASAWVDAPQPGADMDAVPGTVALWLLDETTASGYGVDHPDALAMLMEVRELHRRQIVGEKVDRSTWSEVRTRAIALTDTFDREGPLLLGKLVETLAWPPLTARTILVDGLRLYVDIATLPGRLPSDVDEAERAEINSTMQALFDETASEREADPENYYFPAIFEARFPQMHDRFVADLEMSNRARTGIVMRCADHALALLHAAPAA